ncbi:MAG TPA: class II aldolase [Clostridiaceae bacterium]|nr:class II aldolase [Clostridiaceae bacterium]
MLDERLKELEVMSQTVGKRIDYVQGGGGNTSVKLNDELMAVKASGYKLNQITENEGYVVVNYKNIADYYDKVDLNSGVDYEKDSGEFVKKNIVEFERLKGKNLRPSVEAGFHSILARYVIHTHSVYANILCCSAEGREIAEKIFKDEDFAFIWVPYINPGFSLTLKIKEGIAEISEKKGKKPEAVFMKNHGLIVNSDDLDRCIKLHDRINNIIKDYLGIKEDYPQICVEKVDENTFVSKTKYLSDYFKNNTIDEDFFDRNSLYPDQLVYLNDGISFEGGNGRININTSTGGIIYKANFNEAVTIEETLLAYIYVIDWVQRSGLKLQTMTQEQISFIKNWESEKYRKSLLKGNK